MTHKKSCSLIRLLSVSDIRRVGGEATLAVRPALFVASTVAKMVSPKDRPYCSPRPNIASVTIPTDV